MPLTPQPPAPGDPLRASFAKALTDALRENRVSVGPGLMLRRSPGGTVISLAPGHGPGGASGAGAAGGASHDGVVATITGVRADGRVSVAWYEAGAERTGTAEIANLALEPAQSDVDQSENLASLLVGRRVVVHRGPVQVILVTPED